MSTDRGPTRRDFLAGAAAGGLFAGFGWRPRVALAATAMEAAPEGATIARVRIYPAIGISRVGGSPEWYLAPELPGLPAEPDGGYKDASFYKDGDLLVKKQVQRFRVYAFDDRDRVIGEVTAADAEIAWHVHLANTKAAWYGFNNPLDNGELAPGLPGQKRNQYFVSDARRQEMLVIDGGERTIAGPSVNTDGGHPDHAFSGSFWKSATVRLGELRTDEAGRLLVVPPDGISDAPNGADITSFADNDGWHDDWCDGPVRAMVTLADGRELDAEPSWVACVGPNFAPEIPPITTLLDLIENLNVEQGWSAPPARPLSFARDIFPTIDRAALMAWVSEAAFARKGWLGSADLGDADVLERLADPSEANRAFRQEIFALFRNPENTGPDAYKDERLKIPYMLGEGINYDGSPLQWFQFPKLQYENLRAWAEGDFVDDVAALDERVFAIEDLPVERQPGALTAAALEPCSGGAFHPGVELTYCLRLAPMYARHADPAAESFRIAHGDRPGLIQNLGLLLTPEKALEGHGDVPPAIGPQMPGDLTRWMGLPWQCDAFSCQQVVLQEAFPTPVWWPALLPVNVLPQDAYLQVMRADLTPDDRLRFYNMRVPWARSVAGIGYHANASYWDGITNMIALWQHMGFVVKRPGPDDAGKPAGVPDDLYVEVGRSRDFEARFDWTPEDGMLPQ